MNNYWFLDFTLENLQKIDSKRTIFISPNYNFKMYTFYLKNCLENIYV